MQSKGKCLYFTDIDLKDVTMGESLTKPVHKGKNNWLSQVLEVHSDSRPYYRYILNNEEVKKLITKIANMTKKNLSKIDELLDTGKEAEGEGESQGDSD